MGTTPPAGQAGDPTPEVHEADPSPQHRPPAAPIAPTSPHGYGSANSDDDSEPIDEHVRPLQVSRAVGCGWETFKANLGGWLSMIAFGAVGYAAMIGFVWLFEPASVFLVTLLIVIGTAGSAVFWTALVRGALHELDGRQPHFGVFLDHLRAGRVLAAVAIIAVLTALGFLVCVVPGVAALFLSMFTIQFILDHDMTPTEAIGASARIVAANIVPLALLWLTLAIFLLLGALLCGFGLLLACPTAALATSYAYRRLSYGPIVVTTHPTPNP